ncbi:MAG: hypothetical protein J07HX5_00859, partial [halophilic archaeon J07HX5]
MYPAPTTARLSGTDCNPSAVCEEMICYAVKLEAGYLDWPAPGCDNSMFELNRLS